MKQVITTREQTTAEYYLRYMVENNSKRKLFCKEKYICIPTSIALEIANAIEKSREKKEVKGEWKCNIEWGYGTCSVCGRIFPIRNGNPKADRYNFCPNCGADMRGKLCGDKSH